MKNITKKIPTVGFSKFLFFIGLGLSLFALVVFLFTSLWNWIMPDVFGLKEITILQALGLIVLFKILFGGVNASKTSSSHSSSTKEETVQMQTTEHLEDMNEDALYEKWWSEEGEAYFENYLVNQTQES